MMSLQAGVALILRSCLYANSKCLVQTRALSYRPLRAFGSESEDKSTFALPTPE